MDNDQAITTTAPFPRQYAGELLTLRRGKGVYLRDTAGNKYLDFGAGIAVNALGYGRSDLARIASRQMRRLIHVSNLYTTEPTVAFGRQIVEGANRALGERFEVVHFGNSGAEANEAALKYARLYARERRGEGHHRFLSFSHGFHGRTTGALSVTSNAKYRRKFEPLLPDCHYAPFNDPSALEAALDDSFAAVIVEVVQGEGGLRAMGSEFAESLNRMCEEHDVLLIVDEIQTGLGRCGRRFASELIGLRPDIVTLSKPLGGGLPLSATIIPGKVNDLLELGDHGTTFGGGPVTTAVGQAVWRKITREDFLAGVREKAARLDGSLTELQDRFPFVEELRGFGLLRGLALRCNPDRVSEVIRAALSHARDRGMLLLRSGDDVLRIAPPLVISEKELDRGCEIVADTLSYIETQFEGALK